jgi:hypothetical protein
MTLVKSDCKIVRRDELAAQLAEGHQQYAQFEAALKELDRQLYALLGGIQELDALLAREEPPTEPPND